MECIKCQQECQKEWYIPTSYGGIYPFCSEGCANKHGGELLKGEGYKEVPPWAQISKHELIIDTGTNES